MGVDVTGVTRQLAARHKRHLAALDRALVRLHTSVGVDVITEQSIGSKAPLAKMTLIRTLVSVYFHVSDQIAVTVSVEGALATLIDLTAVSVLICRAFRVRFEVVRIENLDLLLLRISTSRRILKLINRFIISLIFTRLINVAHQGRVFNKSASHLSYLA